jgi:cytochrome P450
VEATISEISRINPIAPITLPHTSLRDTELCGYTIKEVIQVITILLVTCMVTSTFEQSCS